MNLFRFATPWWLIAVLPWLLVTLGAIRGAPPAVLYSDVQVARLLPRTFAQRCRRLLPWVRFTAVCFMFVALARPQLGLEQFRIRTAGIAMQMCIDRSGSMQAVDFELDGKPVNRLEAVKKVFRDFVLGAAGLPGRPDDQIGLIAFGGFAESKSPATLDHELLVQALNDVNIPQPIRDSRGRILNEGLLEQEMATAIGDALALACDRLRHAQARSKIIILLSDGENTAGVVEPAKAAELALAAGIKIYTIGVGSSGYAPFPTTDMFGRQRLTRQLVRLDEATLRQLADSTGGKYFNAQNTDALAEVYAEIDQLEKTIAEGKMFTQYREIFPRFLWPALALVLLEFVLRQTRFRGLTA
jgi:Ca-activated chloride channel family protein